MKENLFWQENVKVKRVKPSRLLRLPVPEWWGINDVGSLYRRLINIGAGCDGYGEQKNGLGIGTVEGVPKMHQQLNDTMNFSKIFRKTSPSSLFHKKS